MPRRVKEEDRTETIICGLLKEPENRRCINCNSLGPQYACTTFWTFVCTNCSAVHREFSHRVKSVSTARFSDDEIMALQAGGNERAKQIYFRSWDPQRSSYPDSSNLQRLREFVNLVYVDRNYAGDRRSNKLPRVKSDSRGNFSDWPSEKARWGRRDDYLGRSPGSNSGRDGFSDCSIFKKSTSSGSMGLSLSDFLEERTPRNTQEMPRSRSHRNRSTRIEVVDDRFRDDGSVRRYERNSLKESGSMSRSPSSLRNTASLPIIHPVDMILGENAPELRIGADDPKAVEGSAGGQKAADATTVRSTGTNDKANEPTTTTSLIDFFDDKPEAEQMASETNNESSSVAYSTTQASAAIVPIDSIESLLFELSSPVTSSAACTSLMSPSATAPAQLNCADSTDVETTKVPGISNSSEALAITVIASDQPLDKDNAYPVMQDMQTHQPPFNTSFNTLQSASSVESLMNEQGNRSSASDDLRRTKSVPSVQSLQAANPSPRARNEIPEDLFTSGYPSFIPAVGGWQTNLPHGAGYSMQFHPPAMSLAAYPNSPKSKNPFDFDDDRFQVQAATFPSMAPFQGDLPNMPAAAASEFQPSPYASALPSQAQNMSSYGMNMHLVPGAYMAKLSNNMLLTRPEGNANFGRSEDPFASLNPIQRGSRAHSLPAAPPTLLSRAGNPFE